MKKLILFSIIMVILLTSCSSVISKVTATPVIFTQTPITTNITHTQQPIETPAPTVTPTKIPIGITEITNLGKGSANLIEWSPDRNSYIIGGSLGIHIFNSDSLEVTNYIPKENVIDVEFSPDGQLIGVRGHHYVTIIRLGDNETIFENDRGFTREMAFSPDSHLYAYGLSGCWDATCNDIIIIHDYSAQEEVITLSIPVGYDPVRVRNIAISSDNSRLAAMGSDRRIYIWDILTGNLIETLPEYRESVSHLKFNPTNNNLLASSSDDGSIRIWDIQNKNIRISFQGFPGTIKTIRFSEDGSSLEIISDSSTQIFNPSSGALISREIFPDTDTSLLLQLRSAGGFIDSLTALAYSPDGQTLAVGSHASSPVLLWDIATQQIQATIDTEAIKLVYSNQGHLLISVDYDDNISVWDTGSLNELQTFVVSPVDSIVFSPNDSNIAISSEGTIHFLDIQQETIDNSIHTDEEKLILLSYSQNGDVISAVDPNSFSVRSWNLSSGEELETFIPPNDPNYREAVNLSDNVLAIFKQTGVENNSIEIWDTLTGEKLQTFFGVDDYMYPRFVFSPDNRVVAISYFYGITLYCTETGNPIYVHDEQVGWARMSFSPDGNYFVIGDGYGNIRLWDVSHIVQAPSCANP
jgi:WD40 repeat protein